MLWSKATLRFGNSYKNSRCVSKIILFKYFRDKWWLQPGGGITWHTRPFRICFLLPYPASSLTFCQAFCASQMANLQFPEWFMHSHASLPLHLMLPCPEHSFTWLTPAYSSRPGLSATCPRKPSLILQVK